MASSFDYGCCPSQTEATDILLCQTCHRNFHYNCITVIKTVTPFEELSEIFKSTWTCPTCLSEQPKTDNSNTPIRNMSSSLYFYTQGDSSSPANITFRKKFNTSESKPDPVDVASVGASMKKELELILESFKASVMKVVNQKINDMLDRFTRVQTTVNNLQKNYEEVKQDVATKTATITALETENRSLHATVTDLSTRLTQLEQHSRSNNIEIQCIPEHRAENLVSTVKQIASITNYTINESDIQVCTRIAKLNRENQRPRSVIVKFGCQRVRDGFLAAVKSFNKKASSSSEKLNSSHLGMAGDRRPIYVMEHLSATLKDLHAAARARAKELNYKFVWVSQGQIFMRKSENSNYVLVKNKNTLVNLA